MWLVTRGKWRFPKFLFNCNTFFMVPLSLCFHHFLSKNLEKTFFFLLLWKSRFSNFFNKITYCCSYDCKNLLSGAKQVFSTFKETKRNYETGFESLGLLTLSGKSTGIYKVKNVKFLKNKKANPKYIFFFIFSWVKKI